MSNHIWTDHDYAKLKTLWEQGYHREVIADKIGCTPNAVSGMVHRRGYERLIDVRTRRRLDTSNDPQPTIPEPEIAPEPEITPEPSPAPEVEPISPPEIEPLPSVEPTLPQPIAAKPKPKPVLRPVATEPAPVPTHERITISPYSKPVVSPKAKEWIFRGARECAYPVGDPSRPAQQECCGNKTEPGKPYCLGHLAVMFPERKAIRSATKPFVQRSARG